MDMTMEQAGEFLSTQGLTFVTRLAAAVAILVVGRWLAGVLSRFLYSVLAKTDIETTLARFAENLAYGALMVFTILASLNRLGVDTTSLAALIAASGLAVGLALQNSLSNFASGVMLMLFKPFQVGDFVNAGGSSGVVEEIDIFHTVMCTGDNVRIIVPNNKITSDTIDNYNAKSTRRIDLVVGCGYDDDLLAVKTFLQELLRSEPRILSEPEPVVAVNELGDSSVDFIVRPWVNGEDYWPVRRDLTERVKLGFDDRRFTIPYPSKDVYLRTAGAAGDGADREDA